ncbi:MAG: hypothetical protein Q9227_005229 [Pyrenula ochraceoflavens]
MAQASISRVGMTEFTQIQGVSHKRRVGTTEWVRVGSPPPPETEHLSLMLVRERQAPDKPFHWSLCLAPEGKEGEKFQVRGDWTAMHYAHESNINIFNSQTFELQDSFIIGRPDQQQCARILHWVNHEPPPSAQTQADAQENCQGWTLRVIARLVAEEVVESRWRDYFYGLLEPLH